MASDFQPNLSILDPPQMRLWHEFNAVPAAFTLCGGTAVALHLGHRRSVDFDFFGTEEFDPDELYATVAFLDGSKVIQRSANTLNALVDREGMVRRITQMLPSTAIDKAFAPTR